MNKLVVYRIPVYVDVKAGNRHEALQIVHLTLAQASRSLYSPVVAFELIPDPVAEQVTADSEGGDID